MRLESIKALEERRRALTGISESLRRRVLVCSGTGCVAGGALDVYAALVEKARSAGVDVEVALGDCGGEHATNGGATYVSKSGCLGFCQVGPLVRVLPEEILYTKVSVRDVDDIVERTLVAGEVVDRLLYVDPRNEKTCRGRNDIPFYSHQTFLALEGVGRVDPESLDDYISHGGYKALCKALFEMKPEAVVEAVDASKLRGRGGGGFLTGRKWKSALKARDASGDAVFVICNGDEGDPGAFMDCFIMEGDPFRVLEGMTIGAYALGSRKGYIYVRHEYPRAVERLSKAIGIARSANLLGDNILGSGFSFDIQINRGGGAFVCGESSALMRSIEGYIGEPRPKYIHSTERGLYEKPTVLNNVETWVNVPKIVLEGADAYKALGTESSTGTKAFCLVGKVNNTGLLEVPMGTTLREIIFGIGGGIQGGREFKAVQTGGPSGGTLPASKLDLPVDFDSLTGAGSMMGSGGMIVMDARNCMVDVAKYFINFLIMESCGKCIPCREGLPQLSHLLDRICNGEGSEADLEAIERLAEVMKTASLCALGKSSVNPVLSTMHYFKDEYLAHVRDKKCPGGVCKALITYSVNDNCTGCLLCKKACPSEAITGEKKKKHVIDPVKCTRCGICESVCKDDAITVE